jgi:hypothetical protein
MRSKDLFFFTLTNPGIETGGFFGESKSQIMRHIPEEFKPQTILIKASINEDELEAILQNAGLSFPLIAKPEVGERGWNIAKLNSLEELKDYLVRHPIDFIVQPFLELPMEVSIMVYKMPDGSHGEVTSICQKEFLIKTLVESNDRAFLHLGKIERRLQDRMNEILPEGQYLLLEEIGNHCRGTKFINRNDQIDDSLKSVMVGLLSSMPDVHYGRFDMKVTSWNDLRKGKGIRVMEFNGASSDPAHIYDPGYSLFKAYKDIFRHWGLMARIARQNKRAGKSPATFKKILSDLKLYFRYKRTNS